MSEEIKSIHEFDIDLICRYYSAFDRQGPGSREATLKALSFIDPPGPASKIADLGCGTGGQTMVLAQHTQGQLTGIDLFPAFIDLFNQNTMKLNLQQSVKGLVGSMDDLPFGEEELDLIWSEGAIYNIGFEKGLNEWYKYLKKGGFIAVTEVSWLSNTRPAEIEQFWMDAYPEIETIASKLEKMQKAGYVPLATFVLPDECWLQNFYEPQEAMQEDFLKENAGNVTAVELVANQRHEYELYKKYKAFYGYVFYIGKK
ncbi:class I SAM-dependent methyltransferase [Roseimarinus sediminis]|uniref:class I SAM-dependent methyltransferase n=1 Tax=Roseimarinus sediminis TaxID=1610899 RepID=UPI003D213DAC